MRHTEHRSRVAIALVALLGGSGLWGASAELDVAHKYYNCTKFEESLKVLDSIPNKDAAVFELTGRNYYMQGDYKKAAEALETALTHDPRNSMAALWLARAYGRRAETSSPFTAPTYASRARQNFERAALLDPHNLEALSDLFEYYLDAPGFLGGGMDKAEASVARIAAVDAAEAQWAQAKLAEKRKQFRAVEEHLRRAIELAPRRIGLRLELARFLARQGRFQEAEESFAHAERVAPGSPRVLFARAEVYVKHSWNLEVAKQILQRYVSLALTPEDPPRAEAAKLLRQVQGS
ncbi:MAG: tetratricopeptide repeat protein [Bryobacteraceae bacterium]